MNRQLIASLLVAALIVVVTIVVVNAHFGPTPAGDDDDDRGRDRIEREDDRSGKD